MKTKLLIAVMVLSFCNTVSAQKLDETKVPALAKQAFAKKYPGVTGKWEKEDGNFEVNFENGGKTMSAVIDNKGAILETETDIAISSLPAGVESYVKSHYKGAAIRKASQITKSNGETIYEADVNKRDVLFDSSGKFIKEARD